MVSSCSDKEASAIELIESLEGDRAKGVDDHAPQDAQLKPFRDRMSTYGQQHDQVRGVVHAEAETKLFVARVLIKQPGQCAGGDGRPQ